MQSLQLIELAGMLKDYADQDSQSVADVTDETADRSFADLGYDSLAVFNVVTEIEQQFNVEISYDDLADNSTPLSLLALINAALHATA